MSDYKNFTETDFEKIKESLKTYLQSQDTLKDYNFDGAALSMLLNVLAYNTQYNAYYGNMLASEKFLNRAQKRKSVVELANNYGYVPYSAKSAKSYLSFDIEVPSGFSSAIIIPKNTKFVSSVDDIQYSFYTTTTSIVAPINGEYSVSNIEVAEGRHFTHKFNVDGTSKFYTIPNKNVDMDRLTVYVKSSSGIDDSLAEEYSFYENISDVTNKSTVYFTQETDSGKYEIYFGDGVLGKSLAVGNQIVIDYYICSGSSANFISDFGYDDVISNIINIRNISATTSFGGAEQESIESIKISTKKSYRSQNRAVVADDFLDKIRNIVPNIKDVMVWGGEDETPKQYGKVFYSAIFDDFSSISKSQDIQIKKQLKDNYMVKGITPEFVTPSYSNIIFNTKVKVIPSTANTSGLIKSDILTSIVDYGTNLNKFGASLYESIIEGTINTSNKNIISNTTRFQLYVNTNENLPTPTVSKIQYPVDIVPSSFYSSDFIYQGTIYNLYGVDGGAVYLKNKSTNIDTQIGSINGSVLYLTASETLYNMISDNVKLYATPVDTDIIVTKNNIIRLLAEDVEIEIQ